ncbi:MAG: hypothetical protein ACLFTV_07990, partial [Desulfococcaceae bacterium]
MSDAHVPFSRSVLKRLIKNLAIIYILVTPTANPVHVWIGFVNIRAQVRENLTAFRQMFQPILREGLCRFDAERRRVAVRGMLMSPFLTGIRIENEFGEVIELAGTVEIEPGSRISWRWKHGPTCSPGSLGFSPGSAGRRSASITTGSMWGGRPSIPAILWCGARCGGIWAAFFFRPCRPPSPCGAAWSGSAAGCSAGRRPTRPWRCGRRIRTNPRPPGAIDAAGESEDQIRVLQDAFNAMVARLGVTFHVRPLSEP